MLRRQRNRWAAAWLVGFSSGFVATVQLGSGQDCHLPGIENRQAPLRRTNLGQTHDRIQPLLMAESEVGLDLNADGDQSDSVLVVYDSQEDRFVNLGLAQERSDEFRNGSEGHLLITMASEPAQGRDLTGDGDTNDQFVGMVWNADTGSLTNLGVTIRKFPQVAGHRVLCIVNEVEDHRDLNGDGDRLDVFALVFDSRSGTRRLYGSTSDGAVLDGAHLFDIESETVAGDLNGDGDLNDFVPVVYDLDQGSRYFIPWVGFTYPLPGDLVALNVLEWVHGDVNGDGDTADSYLVIYDWRASQLHTLISQSASIHGATEEIIYFSSHERTDYVDYNGDGDQSDWITFAYELKTRTLHNSGVFLSRARVASGDLFGSLLESVHGTDLTGDGDVQDEVLHRYSPSRGLTNFGLAIDNWIRGDDRFLAVEVIEKEQRADLNGDSDWKDEVLHVYDSLQGGAWKNVGLAADPDHGSFLLSDRGRAIVGVPESLQGNFDFNGDGDVIDNVVFYVDLVQGRAANLGLDYALGGFLGRNHLSFLVSEADQNADLDGDGNKDRYVLHTMVLRDLEWSLQGSLMGGGTVLFEATSAPLLAGSSAAVAISLGNGQRTGGIPLPNSGGQRLGLDLDPALLFWCRLPKPTRESSLNGCLGARTAAVIVPPQLPPGLEVYYAGFSFDGTGAVSAVSATRSAILQ